MKTKLRTIVPALLLGLSSSAVFANITLEERTIPSPTGVSSEFAALLEDRSIPPLLPVPSTNDEWIALQAQFDIPGIEISKQAAQRLEVEYESQNFAGVDTFFVTPKRVAAEYADKWLVHIHGGAFVFGGGESALREAIWVANGLGAKVISIDYRQPPLHPFPAAIDDAVAVWKELTKTQSPESTAIFGTSAGGNLTLATTLKLQEMGLPTPGALFVGTPAVDLKETSDSWHTLKGLDPLGQREGLIQGAFNLYANGKPLDNPLVSPIYAEIESFPPTVFISGTRDLLLSDTVRMHRLLRSADVESELHIYDGQSHGDYTNGLIIDMPESKDALKELGAFFDKHIN
ncbi:alpha/beta hydrolase fold domain-containing protein [Shewanella atlantica]|uniref:Alpha/beta hydrolase n=1 Tax=Shewanella atlantica TaxID=271099 RepID=A0A431WD56_9GAMM|nr:alpha/beta hydrolase fold domain-containing protein [Shewanella atlantica]RTR33278.1 alpha/beta hydrolase [Shewanella atlantica]